MFAELKYPTHKTLNHSQLYFIKSCKYASLNFIWLRNKITPLLLYVIHLSFINHANISPFCASFLQIYEKKEFMTVIISFKLILPFLNVSRHLFFA